MALPRFEVASGSVDGVNTTFRVSVPYVPGSLALFVNGKLYRQDWDDGWIETNPATGTFDLKEAPLAGDVIQVFFTDTGLGATEEELCTLKGTIRDTDSVKGLVVDCLCGC